MQEQLSRASDNYEYDDKGLGPAAARDYCCRFALSMDEVIIILPQRTLIRKSTCTSSTCLRYRPAGCWGSECNSVQRATVGDRSKRRRWPMVVVRIKLEFWFPLAANPESYLDDMQPSGRPALATTETTCTAFAAVRILANGSLHM